MTNSYIISSNLIINTFDHIEYIIISNNTEDYITEIVTLMSFERYMSTLLSDNSYNYLRLDLDSISMMKKFVEDEHMISDFIITFAKNVLSMY